MTIQSSDGTLSAELVRSARKTMSLQVFGDGSVVIRAPKCVKDREALEFMEKHRAWILTKRHQLEQRAEQRKEQQEQYGIPPYDSLGQAEKDMICQHFIDRLEHYAPLMGVDYGQVHIRNQKGRWGSCSSKGNLNFNYRLHYLPQELMDYVIVHELAHRVYMNHSSKFWGLVQAYMPEYKEYQKRLHDIGIR
ncbi:MAG: M48 family metallopeptidase [Lachnospiraceae bacterium]|nr:M48 family metallopeptidase [Lachnospiraceae bacterium]